MDTIADPNIEFNQDGISNYYFDYQRKAKSRLFNTPSQSHKLGEIINKMKLSGKGREYDCIIGIVV